MLRKAIALGGGAALVVTAWVGCSSDPSSPAASAGADAGLDGARAPIPDTNDGDAGLACAADCRVRHARGAALDDAIDRCWTSACPVCTAADAGASSAPDAGDAGDDAGIPACGSVPVGTPSAACNACTAAACCAPWAACFGDADCVALEACLQDCARLVTP